MRIGVIFRKYSLWVGVHYSPVYKRWCINLLPCITIWVTMEGGVSPNGGEGTFKVGDKVYKHSGDYHLKGTVVASFKKLDGKVRYVVEHHPGFLHIYSDKNIITDNVEDIRFYDS